MKTLQANMMVFQDDRPVGMVRDLVISRQTRNIYAGMSCPPNSYTSITGYMKVYFMKGFTEEFSQNIFIEDLNSYSFNINISTRNESSWIKELFVINESAVISEEIIMIETAYIATEVDPVMDNLLEENYNQIHFVS